ncbi:hypothetical protein, partial [Acetobacter fabarum]
ERNHAAEINSQSYSAKRNEISNHRHCIQQKLPELTNIDDQIKEHHEKLIGKLSRIISSMQKELSVPHKPY